MKGDTTLETAMADSVRGKKSDGEGERLQCINYTALGCGRGHAGLDVRAPGSGRHGHCGQAAWLASDTGVFALGGGPDSDGSSDRACHGGTRPPRGPEVWRVAERHVWERRRANHRRDRPKG